MRSGVNCTRLVSTRQRRGEAAHEEGLGDAGDALEQDVALREQGDEQARDGGVLADDGLGHLGADRAAAPPARAAPGLPGRSEGAAGGVGVGWRCSVMRCGPSPRDRPAPGRASGAPVGGGWRSGQQRATWPAGHRWRPRPAAGERADVAVEPASRRASRPVVAVAGSRPTRGPVARPAVEPGAALGRLGGADDDGQGLGDQGPEATAADARRGRATRRADEGGRRGQSSPARRDGASPGPKSARSPSPGWYQTSRGECPRARTARPACDSSSTRRLVRAAAEAERPRPRGGSRTPAPRPSRRRGTGRPARGWSVVGRAARSRASRVGLRRRSVGRKRTSTTSTASSVRATGDSQPASHPGGAGPRHCHERDVERRQLGARRATAGPAGRRAVLTSPSSRAASTPR